MKKQHSTPAISYGGATPRSQALIALPRAAPRPGLLATAARALLLLVRLPILAVVAVGRGAAWTLMGLCRGAAAMGRGLGQGVGALLRGIVRLAVAPFVLLGRILGLLVRGAGALGRGLGHGVGALGRGLVRLAIAPFVLLGKLAVGILRLAGLLGRGVAWTLAGLGRGVGLGVAALLRLLVLPFVLLGRLAVALARLLGFLGRGAAWALARAGRGTAILLRKIVLLPIRAVVLLARLVALSGRLATRLLVLVLRAPFVLLRLLGRGGVVAARGLAGGISAVAVPVVALAWSAVRFLVAGLVATLVGIGRALAFLARLLVRGVLALGLGGVTCVVALARGLFACLRLVFRLVIWVAMLPLLAARALLRGVGGLARLFVKAARTVATGLTVIACSVIAVLGYLGSAVGRMLRPVGSFVASTHPARAACLPLATLLALACAEIGVGGGFPFVTLGLLLVAAFSFLAALARPTVPTVLLAWFLSLAAAWRAERVGLETPAWIDALIYVTALAALRAAYVSARTLVREAPATPRAAEQEVAHRRASLAIGIVLAAQGIGFAAWSMASGVSSTPVFGELLLVGAGILLAFVVRSGQYLRAAQAVLSAGALAALVAAIAAQFSAFAQGRIVTPASAGAGALLMLVATALTIVVHTRLVDVEHGA